MKLELEGILVCPKCKSKLQLHTFAEAEGEIKDGAFECPKCSSVWPIVDFIPRMLPPDLYYNKTFIDKYQDRLNQLNIAMEKLSPKQPLPDRLKKETIEKFGFEWLEYGRFGWDDPVFNMEREERVFKKKTMFSPQDLQGKLVLDAGCGNGRYSNCAARYGARVIGVDLGDGVKSAYQNTRSNKNIHIIQGDIFNLPFPKETFNTIFSIGVLHHTGNARLALKTLVKHLKEDGIMSFHVYGKCNPVYEINNFVLRKITTRLSNRQLNSFTRVMFVIARFLDRINILKYVNYLVYLENHPHCIFDWYSAPIATHHTYSEICEWCNSSGLKIIEPKPETRTVRAIKL